MDAPSGRPDPRLELWIIEVQYPRLINTSVRDLNAQLRAYIDGWNDDRAHAFTWIKTRPDPRQGQP